MIRQTQTRRTIETTHDVDLGPCVATFNVSCKYLPCDHHAEGWNVDLDGIKHKHYGASYEPIKATWDGLWDWLCEGLKKSIEGDGELANELIERALEN